MMLIDASIEKRTEHCGEIIFGLFFYFYPKAEKIL